MKTTEPAAIHPARRPSVDALRGATVAAMVLVNNPGAWDHVYPPLLHAPWDGCTPTDLIFPFFLFVVGISMRLSLGRHERTAWREHTLPAARVWGRVLRRSVTLIALGLFLNGFPEFNLSEFRWTGVLQRIGLCFVAAFALVALLPTRARWGFSVGALAWYAWYVWGRGQHPLPEGNAAMSVDLWLIPKPHLYWGGWKHDPEGVLGTIPSVVTVLLGFDAGRWMLVPGETPMRRMRRAWIAGAAGLGVAGLALFIAEVSKVPLNKPLWSPTYVVFAAGLGAAALAILIGMMECGSAFWARLWTWAVVFGSNAILLFVGSGLLARVLSAVRVGDGTLKSWVYACGFESWLSPINASLGFALANLAVWWVVCWALWRRGWLLKV